MNTKTKATVAALTLEEFGQVCDQVDADLGEAMAGVFAQRRTRWKAAAYVETLCRDDVPVKTCWDMAQAAGLDQPRPFQSLMSVNDWDAGDLWNVIGKMASTSLVCPDGDPLGPGIAVDETGQPKRGRHTAGVGVQYAGFAGRKVNCVTSVTLCLITPGASTWVGNELFLQEKEWFCGQDDTGTARRHSVGVETDLAFASKPEIARRKLADLRAAGVAFGWSAGDEVYGRSATLRKDHEENAEAYAYFVPRDFMVDLPHGARVRADETLDLARGRSEVRACGDGLNGPRLYAWTMIATASPDHFLVIRQPVEDNGPAPATRGEGTEQGTGHDAAPRNPRTEKLAPGTGFMYCHVPKDSPIAATFSNLLLMIGRRWPVEETIAVGKGPIGWDQNQFRNYSSIQRHNALSGMAMLRATLTGGVSVAGPGNRSLDASSCAPTPGTTHVPGQPTVLFFADRHFRFERFLSQVSNEFCQTSDATLIMADGSSNRFMNLTPRPGSSYTWPLFYYSAGLQCRELETLSKGDPKQQITQRPQATALIAQATVFVANCDTGQQIGDHVAPFWDAAELAVTLFGQGVPAHLSTINVTVPLAEGDAVIRNGKIDLGSPPIPLVPLCVPSIYGSSSRSVTACGQPDGNTGRTPFMDVNRTLPHVILN